MRKTAIVVLVCNSLIASSGFAEEAKPATHPMTVKETYEAIVLREGDVSGYDLASSRASELRITNSPRGLSFGDIGLHPSWLQVFSGTYFEVGIRYALFDSTSQARAAAEYTAKGISSGYKKNLDFLLQHELTGFDFLGFLPHPSGITRREQVLGRLGRVLIIIRVNDAEDVETAQQPSLEDMQSTLVDFVKAVGERIKSSPTDRAAVRSLYTEKRSCEETAPELASMVLGPEDFPNLLIQQCQGWDWVQALRDANEAQAWYGLEKTQLKGPKGPGLIQFVVVENESVFVQIAAFPNNSAACTFAEAMRFLMEAKGQEVVGSEDCPGDRCWHGSCQTSTAISACVGSSVFVITKLGREEDKKTSSELCSRLARSLVAKAREGDSDVRGVR